MKRNFTFLVAVFTVLFAVMLFVPAASAQKAGHITIPFPFVANHQDMPAGEYAFDVNNPVILKLFDVNAGRYRAALMVRSHVVDGRLTTSGMTFKWNGVAWVLSDVHLANLSVQSDLSVQPRPVREIATNATHPMPTIFIAMK